MKNLIALCAALAVAAFSFVASEAAEVQIGDFVFGCKTADGKIRKPQFGDMNGVFYTDIRGQEKACRDAVKRMIANCHQHTRFLNPGDNRRYPECLPVFQEQAGECAAFFRAEIAKCSGDGGGAADSAAITHGVITMPVGSLWPGYRYEGPIRDGVPHGRGVVTTPEWKSCSNRVETEFRNGVANGAFERIAVCDGSTLREEGHFRNGKRHGRHIYKYTGGRRDACVVYENGEEMRAC